MKNIITNKLWYSLLFIAMLPMGALAQTMSENHVVTKVYKEASTTPITGTNKDKVSTTVQYFDGLGRAKQSVAVQAGGVLANSNEVPIDWILNNTGTTGFYNAIGTAPESKIVNGTTPFGHTDLLWECIPDAASNADGGWNSDAIEIDNTKTYRYTVWVKKTGNRTSGYTYHGIGFSTVKNLTDGAVNPNPYFVANHLPQLNTWYLMVGVVHPHDYTGGDTGKSGVYDTNGNKVVNGVEYKWRSDKTSTILRNYLYYATDTSVRQYFWSPLFQQVNGGELSINDLTSSHSAITSQTPPKDIVTHFEYDALGRQTKEYLPYAKTTNNGAITTGDIATATKSYYQVKHVKDFAGVSLPNINAYSEKVIENSPLGKVFEQAAPGKDWAKGTTYAAKGYTNNSHSIKFEYGVNVVNEVKSFEVATSFANNTYTPTLIGGGFYNAGTLSKTVTKDENWETADGVNHSTEEFKNKQGQVILKRTYNAGQKHDTYYVYDDFGNLTYVLPPKIEASTVSLSTTISKLNDLGYQYKYDNRNRLVEKKIPGKGWEYIVYDKLDRPVLTQDANLKAQNKWLFTKYDQLGRVAYTGIQTNQTASRITLQGYANTGNYTQFESRQISSRNIGGTTIYYTSSAIPGSPTGVYTINYYDSYIDLPTGLSATVTNSYGVTSTANTTGLATVTKTRVLGTGSWITTVSYYDIKGRPIYVYSQNDVLNTKDIVESKLDDFTGKVLETKTTHKKQGKADIVTIDRFEYDHMDRLVSQTQQINNQISERIVKNNYDELGQLASKLTGNGTRKGYKDVTSGISISNNIITKTGATGWNSIGLATLGSIVGDGYVEHQTVSTSTYYFVGLSSSNINGHYNTIDYALYNDGPYLAVYEKGQGRGRIGTSNVGDVLRVERIGSEIHYKQNGKTLYISQMPSSGVLLGDASMFTSGTQIKDFKIVDNSKGLQKVDYNYNVRGWLKNINQDGKNDNDLFNFSLKYNDPTTGTALYNGNISQTSWNTLNTDTSSKTYTYSYDALNRILSATGVNGSNYDVSGISYDKNGNILSLLRKGHINNAATSFGIMDDLSYSYDSGNKLVVVDDDEETNYGFIDKSNSGNDYTYDINGNMVSDVNKGIERIYYNHLNLPTYVAVNGKGDIYYTYDATGAKIKKVVGSTTTEYAGNQIYENGNLQFFNHPEGYYNVTSSPTSGELEGAYIYQYKDHLEGGALRKGIVYLFSERASWRLGEG